MHHPLTREYLKWYHEYARRLSAFGLPVPKPCPEALETTIGLVEEFIVVAEIQKLRKQICLMKKECSICCMLMRYVVVPVIVIGTVLVCLNVMR